METTISQSLVLDYLCQEFPSVYHRIKRHERRHRRRPSKRVKDLPPLRKLVKKYKTKTEADRLDKMAVDFFVVSLVSDYLSRHEEFSETSKAFNHRFGIGLVWKPKCRLRMEDFGSLVVKYNTLRHSTEGSDTDDIAEQTNNPTNDCQTNGSSTENVSESDDESVLLEGTSENLIEISSESDDEPMLSEVVDLSHNKLPHNKLAFKKCDMERNSPKRSFVESVTWTIDTTGDNTLKECVTEEEDSDSEVSNRILNSYTSNGLSRPKRSYPDCNTRHRITETLSPDHGDFQSSVRYPEPNDESGQEQESQNNESDNENVPSFMFKLPEPGSPKGEKGKNDQLRKRQDQDHELATRKNHEQQVCLSDKVPIRTGFSDIYDQLDMSKNLDRVVKYILDRNISISNLNAKHKVTVKNVRQSVERKYFSENSVDKRKIVINRFTPDEDQIIANNWNQLLKDVEETSHELLFQEVAATTDVKKRIVIGCYLALGMTKLRSGDDVCTHMVKLLTYQSGRRKLFTEEEDDLIIEEVRRNGPSIQTFQLLALRLNRAATKSSYRIIQKRYELLMDSKKYVTGHWSLEEDCSLIEFVMSHHSGKKVTEFKVRGIAFFDPLHATLRRKSRSLHNRWFLTIFPILAAYHHDQLYQNPVYPIMQFLMEKKVRHKDEIPWIQLLRMFPDQTRMSIYQRGVHNPCLNAVDQGCPPEAPIHEKISFVVDRYKDKKFTECEEKRRSDIVKYYLTLLKG